MDKRALKLFKKDLAATLGKYKGLQLKTLEGNNFLLGTYPVRDNLNIIQEEYEILIQVPNSYPLGFPTLREISKKIPRHIDRHIDEAGLACLEIEQKIILISKKGITLKDFIEKYVNRYFCWQLLYDNNSLNELEQWSHYEKGTLEFYQIELRTEDLSIIKNIIHNIINNKLPTRNDLCVCNSGNKFKNCHQLPIASIIGLGKEQLKKDIDYITAVYSV